MSRSQENYNKKRSLIISAAWELFLVWGYAGTSMDGVASAAGVTKQTVYRYFASKSDLFAAVLDSASDADDDYVFGRMGVLEELIRYGETVLSAEMEKRRIDLWRLTIAESGDKGAVSEIMRKKTQRKDGALIGFLRDRLLLAEPELYAEIFFSMLLVMREKIVLGQADVPDGYSIRKHAETTAEIFVNGVLGL